MKKFGKVFCLCIAGVLTFALLSGCGGNGKPGESTDNSTPTDADYSIEAKG